MAKESQAGPQAGREGAVETAQKRFGRGALLRFRGDALPEVEGISTGSPSLDLALGGSGLPRGRIVEIFGSEGTGKTTLALHAVANAQKGGGVAAFIDAEHALDPGYAARLGVDAANLLVSQPMTGEEALEIGEILVRSAAVGLVVVDSVAALVPRAELEGEMGDCALGLQARLMSQALRKLSSAIHRTRTSVVFLNQIREKIGVFFGNPETTPGGRALKFYATARVELRRLGSVREGDEVVGIRIEAKVVKNKLFPPFRRAEFDFDFARGIARELDLLDLAARLGVLQKSGAAYAFEGTGLGRGREEAGRALKERPDLFGRILAAARAKYPSA